MLKSILKKFEKASKSMYQLVGEEQGTRELVKNFYHIMENDTKATNCLNVHELIDKRIPPHVAEKLFMFLSGWFGGPNLFVETYGHPRMRARHLHIKIGTAESSEWLYCMNKALDMHSIQIKRKDKKLMSNSFKALTMRIKNDPKEK
jgi:hemoglobin